MWQIANSATTTVSVLLSNSGTFQIANSASASAATATSTGTFGIATAGSFSAGTLNINGGKFQVSEPAAASQLRTLSEFGETGSGAPAFQIVNGATATSRTGIIGDVNGSNGTANIDGAGSSWTVWDHLAMGGTQSGSTGTLTIWNGATVGDSSRAFNDATTCIGCATGSTGTVVVAGSNTATPGCNSQYQGLQCKQRRICQHLVGQSGTGTLTVADGGISSPPVAAPAQYEVAVNSGSTGTLTLAQSNSTSSRPTINASTIQFGAAPASRSSAWTQAPLTPLARRSQAMVSSLSPQQA